MNKIVVTGGCGYIGSQTIIELIKKTDYDVVSVDNFMNSSPAAIDRIEKITGKKVTNYVIDLCSYEDVRSFFQAHKDIVGIIHFAALKSVPESVADPVLYYKNNLDSVLNMIQCCNEFNVRNFIFSSSCSVYGNVASLPVTEDTVLGQVVSPYAHTKLMAEHMIKFITDQSNLNCILLRYFNPVGSDLSGMNGEDPINAPSNLVPVITQTAAGIRKEMYVFGEDYDTRDGSCIRDYVHVIDISDAHIKALNRLINKNNKSNYEIYNLGTGTGITVFEAIKAFEDVTGVPLNYFVSPRREGDVAAIYSDSSKAKQELGWTPIYAIREMMETAWKWQLYIKDNK